jgi:AraC-like DNA-binding protein
MGHGGNSVCVAAEPVAKRRFPQYWFHGIFSGFIRLAFAPSSPIYDPSRAFGDLAIRDLLPTVMDAPHWHGHVEINALNGAAMRYDFDGHDVELPDGTVAMFWAGVPHRSTQLRPTGATPPRLTNIYLPLDRFLLMPHIAGLQGLLLAGAVVALPPDLFDAPRLAQWRGDIASGVAERQAMLLMEINAALRRASANAPRFLHRPKGAATNVPDLSSSNVRHVVAMIRHVMENLDAPLANRDVTAVTGLHMNYALNIFSSVMRIPLKRFIIRMRLVRARGLLAESDLPVATIAAKCGFGSLSQFYEAFGAAYGTTPRGARLGAAAARRAPESASS